VVAAKPLPPYSYAVSDVCDNHLAWLLTVLTGFLAFFSTVVAPSSSSSGSELLQEIRSRIELQERRWPPLLQGEMRWREMSGGDAWKEFSLWRSVKSDQLLLKFQIESYGSLENVIEKIVSTFMA
jgi:hypothetical protein